VSPIARFAGPPTTLFFKDKGSAGVTHGTRWNHRTCPFFHVSDSRFPPLYRL